MCSLTRNEIEVYVLWQDPVFVLSYHFYWRITFRQQSIRKYTADTPKDSHYPAGESNVGCLTL